MPEVEYPADGNLYIGWLPDTAGTAISDVHAPTMLELASIVDLSCKIMSGGVAMNISTGTIDTSSVCSGNVSQTSGRVTAAPALTGKRYKQPDDTFWDLCEKGNRGWLLVRSGLPTETALADGQQVGLGYFEMQEPTPEYPGGDTMTTFVENFLLAKGQLFDQKAVIGGES